MASHKEFTPEVINGLSASPGKRQEIHSAKSHPGLQVITSSSGRKSFAVQFSLGGKTDRLKLGDIVGAIGLAELQEAAVQAIEIRRSAAQGKDPRAQKARSAAVARLQDQTLAEVWAQYAQSDKFLRLRRQSQRTYQSVWDHALEPVLGNRLLTIIKLDDLLFAHRRIVKSNGEGMARLAMIIFTNVWNYADRHDMVPADIRPPYRYLRAELGAAMGTRVRTQDVPDDILPELWRLTHVWEEATDRPPTGAVGAAIRFCLLTGLRSNELRGLRWDDIDLEARTLFLPASRMKSKRDFRVPLNSLAMLELYRLRYPSDENPNVGTYVFGRMSQAMIKALIEMFGGSRKIVRRKSFEPAGDLPLGNISPTLVRLANEAGADARITPHCLRKTFARHVEASADFLSAKRLLGHSMSGDVTAGYISEDIERLRIAGESVVGRYKELLGDALRLDEPRTVHYRVRVLEEV